MYKPLFWKKMHYLVRNTTTIIYLFISDLNSLCTRSIIYNVLFLSQRDYRTAVNQTWAHTYAHFASDQFECDMHRVKAHNQSSIRLLTVCKLTTPTVLHSHE